MKTFLQKLFVLGCLASLAAAFSTTVMAARTGTSPIIVITIPKPVVSAH